MKCKDCLENVDKLTKTGICKRCYARMANAKYQGKKYIPIKDLSEEDKNKIFGMRENRQKILKEKPLKKQNKDNKLKFKTDEPEKNDADEQYQKFINEIAQGDSTLYEQILKLLNINEQEIRKEVDVDIEKEFERRKISLKYDNYVTLDNAFETLWCVCNQDNYLTEYNVAEQTLTDFVNDFQHQNENTKLSDLRKFVTVSIMENQALIRRRPIKDVVIQLDCTQKLRDYIQKDTTLMNLINDTRIALKNEVERQKNPVYVSKASELILNSGNVLPEKKAVKQKYDVFVPCYNLFGNKNRDTFRLTGGTFANSPEEAKEILKKTLRRYFPSVTYKEIDIQAVPMVAQKEGA